MFVLLCVLGPTVRLVVILSWCLLSTFVTFPFHFSNCFSFSGSSSFMLYTLLRVCLLILRHSKDLTNALNRQHQTFNNRKYIFILFLPPMFHLHVLGPQLCDYFFSYSFFCQSVCSVWASFRQLLCFFWARRPSCSERIMSLSWAKWSCYRYLSSKWIIQTDRLNDVLAMKEFKYRECL